ncbi:uncharacterized protein LOC116339647 [Contarinia nasturtii]|uniref:uncharacterized protein LOC116339647 n=1 Tax=Contarinia nasturtii TaxID=265458 RepID=UPI0012D41FD6|nr:uncharacterized protein LOC116339647 [Contarinia nasturtii]
MWQIHYLVALFSVASTFGAPQFIQGPLYYTPQRQFQSIKPSEQYVLLYPQYQLVVPREGEEGGEGDSFSWANVFNCFSGGGGGSLRAVIPPGIDTKHPDGEQDQKESTDKNQIDRKPSKPYQYILPPAPDFNYYFPQPDLFARPPIFPKYIASNSITFPRVRLVNQQKDPRSIESSTEIPSITSNGHANEKNVN